MDHGTSHEWVVRSLGVLAAHICMEFCQDLQVRKKKNMK